MGMDIVGNGIDPFRDRIFRLFRMVDVAVLKMVQPEKKLREDTVQEQFGRICELLGPGMAGKVYDPVQDIDQDRLPVIRETVDRKRGVERGEYFIIGVPKTITVVPVQEGNDKPPGRLPFRIAGFVKKRRGEKDEIIRPDRIRDSFYKMESAGTEQDVDLIVGMEMLEFHVSGIGAGVKIEKIKHHIRDVVYNDEAFFFIINLVWHKPTCFL